MDTVYYTLHTKKVKVSGGADLLMLTPSAVTSPAAPAGEVLDFARCRRKLETKAAWKDLARAVEDVRAESGWQEDDGGEEACKPVAARERRMERAGGWMELCASAAVILVSLSAALAFFSLV